MKPTERERLVSLYFTELRRMLIANKRDLQAELDKTEKAKFKNIPEFTLAACRELTNDYLMECAKLYDNKFKDLMI